MKNINLEWLEKNNACEEGKSWFLNHSFKNIESLLVTLVKEERFNWANWTITKLFTHKQAILFACYAARLSLKHFEKRYRKDKRPRKAILAAEKYAKNPTKANRSAAESAAWSARSAESAAWSSLSARSAAESSWSAAESAARSAAWSARSAESAARSAGSSWSAAESAARSAAWKDILTFGLELLIKGESSEK